MADRVDAVIAALRIALEEAERSQDFVWKVRNANRWIDQLPGSLFLRWRHLKLVSDSGQVGRIEFVGHARASIAYLVANRETMRSQRFWYWSAPKFPTAENDLPPIDTEFEEVPGSDAKKLPKPSKPMRVVR